MIILSYSKIKLVLECTHLKKNVRAPKISYRLKDGIQWVPYWGLQILGPTVQHLAAQDFWIPELITQYDTIRYDLRFWYLFRFYSRKYSTHSPEVNFRTESKLVHKWKVMFMFTFRWFNKYAKYREFHNVLPVPQFSEASDKHPPFVLNRENP